MAHVVLTHHLVRYAQGLFLSDGVRALSHKLADSRVHGSILALMPKQRACQLPTRRDSIRSLNLDSRCRRLEFGRRGIAERFGAAFARRVQDRAGPANDALCAAAAVAIHFPWHGGCSVVPVIRDLRIQVHRTDANVMRGADTMVANLSETVQGNRRGAPVGRLRRGWIECTTSCGVRSRVADCLASSPSSGAEAKSMWIP